LPFAFLSTLLYSAIKLPCDHPSRLLVYAGAKSLAKENESMTLGVCLYFVLARVKGKCTIIDPSFKDRPRKIYSPHHPLSPPDRLPACLPALIMVIESGIASGHLPILLSMTFHNPRKSFLLDHGKAPFLLLFEKNRPLEAPPHSKSACPVQAESVKHRIKSEGHPSALPPPLFNKVQILAAQNR
jgi:hypothetical protein